MWSTIEAFILAPYPETSRTSPGLQGLRVDKAAANIAVIRREQGEYRWCRPLGQISSDSVGPAAITAQSGAAFPYPATYEEGRRGCHEIGGTLVFKPGQETWFGHFC